MAKPSLSNHLILATAESVPELHGCCETGLRELWTCDREALTLDPTYNRDAWVVLVVDVVYREHSILMTWQAAVLASEPWDAHFRLLAVPAGMLVHALCGQGCRDLWRQNKGLASHPALSTAHHF